MQIPPGTAARAVSHAPSDAIVRGGRRPYQYRACVIFPSIDCRPVRLRDVAAVEF